ncbi:hypothetical protein EV207_1393 [Scopulibacillus darangshiensis]|uniref:GDSL-like lipase/acylhydrolase family protein n=1 Tax=Scopulibacillus darangshiensis TaxID=442528 RepID=A0A4R2NK83_9BACL|nr:DUF6270 domain-containing protein [Scopulibacillus darangshiensis]TCP21861.1 hypothetical protein EV207_1393 [Scopulibacillus darangshiensis]
MQKTKVAVIGSAATRGCFELSNARDLEDIFDVSLIQYQSSLLSIMSEPIENYDMDENISPLYKKIITEDLDKGIFDRLKGVDPDYVVIDFAPDITYGTLRIGDRYITNNKKKLKHVKLNDQAEEFTINNNKEAYVRKWTEAFHAFVQQLNDILPSAKVVVHTANFVGSYFDKTYRLKSLRRTDIQAKNNEIKELTAAINQDGITVIDLSDNKYNTSSSHKWKAGYIHYETKYYNDFLLAFFQLVIKNLNQAKELQHEGGPSYV